MVVEPANLQDLCTALAAAHAQSAKLPALDLRHLNRIVEHTPEDMTATLEAGMPLADLQASLRQSGQWLPVDPPQAEKLTIARLLSTNASGPRRFGYGTIREYLLGLKVALADGRVIKAGGKVVKNVAGYDLCKLLVGSKDSLGVIVEATFKLCPLPEAEQFVQARCESLDKADALIEAVVESDLAPVVLDLHNWPAASGARASSFFVVLGFAGTREEVDWQSAKARELYLSEPSNLDYEAAFWIEKAAPPLRNISVLPSRVTQTIRDLGDVPFIARAGNGVIYYRGGPNPPAEELPKQLMQRVKDTYDPKHILPELPC
jgi:FAD/FMN-containing dehydrogenase